jgi:predicted nucleic acid-binding Zn ribbon protein
MASKSSKSNKKKQIVKPKIDREKRRQRTMSYIFLGISVILIISMLLAAVAKF